MKKINNPESIIELYRGSVKNLSFIMKKESKWIIDKPYSKDQIQQFLNIIESVIQRLKKEGLKAG
jgi:predicted nucleotidyltransferase